MAGATACGGRYCGSPGDCECDERAKNSVNTLRTSTDLADIAYAHQILRTGNPAAAIAALKDNPGA